MGKINSIDDILEKLRNNNGDKMADTFQYLVDNVEKYEEGEIEVDDLPVKNDVGHVILSSVIFGVFFEREYPSTDFESLVHRLEHIVSLLHEHHQDKLDMDEYGELFDDS